MSTTLRQKWKRDLQVLEGDVIDVLFFAVGSQVRVAIGHLLDKQEIRMLGGGHVYSRMSISKEPPVTRH